MARCQVIGRFWAYLFAPMGLDAAPPPTRTGVKGRLRRRTEAAAASLSLTRPWVGGSGWSGEPCSHQAHRGNALRTFRLGSYPVRLTIRRPHWICAYSLVFAATVWACRRVWVTRSTENMPQLAGGEMPKGLEVKGERFLGE